MSVVRFCILCLVPLIFVGCGASQSEIDSLNRRIATLEKRVRILEGGAPVARAKVKQKAKGGKRKHKAKAGGGAAAAKEAPRGAVEVAGNAVKVFLKGPKRRWPVPGTVPGGGYEVLASFDDASAPEMVGEVKVLPNGVTRITCVASAKRCTSELVQ